MRDEFRFKENEFGFIVVAIWLNAFGPLDPGACTVKEEHILGWELAIRRRKEPLLW